ncbi:MAG: hypothetical protein CVU71_09985 [Deltaproteobacteria bacterium HGW-Deltaproteobacteria-6]|jgi:hypothetical protein|nr:MAG: hypothetical protein CVU71_09985 [Deltaproteobacteria bacterium HGW-Deltaproteobacteria-6]
MKKTGLIILMAILCFFTVMNNNASAWSVEVESPWWWPGQVKMCTEKLIGSDECDTKDIVKGGTISFHTGARCPKSLSGKYIIYKQNEFVSIALQPVSMHSGNDISDISEGRMACRDTGWKICRKRGTTGDYSNLQNNDFGFCKK